MIGAKWQMLVCWCWGIKEGQRIASNVAKVFALRKKGDSNGGR
jgi:hypothetical protein